MTRNLPQAICGFDLNMDLLAEPSIGDFLPPSTTLGGSSACLVPTAESEAATGWNGLARPTLDNAVDFVTGMPLIQVQDLSLPLDGASFRLVRTRSQNTGLRSDFCFDHIDKWWDWTGEGWMISENPFLMIDSSVPDVVGDRPRTSYLILDAHHSIPFQLIESTGLYEAPARFRARMTHNGTWNASQRKWQIAPSSFTIALYDGQLMYTFAAIYEDVPDTSWQPSISNVSSPCTPESAGLCPSSLHDRPFLLQQLKRISSPFDYWGPWGISNPGVGMPYYGLCTRIADKYGHEIRIHYCGFRQSGMDDPDTECAECYQNCPAKGQIKSITLHSGGAVKWTLMYRYRIAETDILINQFWPHNNVEDGPQFIPQDAEDRYGRRVIYSIFVYEGDKTSAIEAYSPCQAIATTTFMSPPPGGANVDALDQGEDLTLGAPADWKYRVRYHYSYRDADPYDGVVRSGPTSYLPLLLKTTVETRLASTSATVSKRSTVFKYAGVSPVQSSNDRRDAWLEAVLLPEDMDRALAAVRAPSVGASWVTINHIAQWTSEDGFSGMDTSIADRILACASIRVDPTGGEVDRQSASPTGPSWESFFAANANGSSYLKQSMDDIIEGYWYGAPLQYRPVQTASIRDRSGLTHYYRIFRYAVKPEGSNGGNLSHLDCQPSAMFAPYSWLGYGRNTDDCAGTMPLMNPPADYTKARWISIVDEFDSLESMNAPVDYGSGSSPTYAAYSIKQGQVSRRVVEVSASGVPLRDRSWTFTPNGVVTSGNGLGEEYVYEKAALLLNIPETWTPPPTYPAGTTPDEVVYSDPLASLRKELVLVEQRSVGWSAAYLADTSSNEELRGATQGLVRFFEYEPYQYSGRPDWQPDGGNRDQNNDGISDDAVISLQLSGEGIKQGRAFLGREGPNGLGKLVESSAGGPKMYLRRVFHQPNPDREPTAGYEHDCEVTFSTVSVDVSQFTCPAVGDVPADGSWTATHTLTFRRQVDNPAVPLVERPIRSRLVIGAPKRQRPGPSPWYFPVEREWYSDRGAMTWAASGLVKNPIQPSADPDPVDGELQSLSFTRYFRDDTDRPVHTVMDIGTGAPLRVNEHAPLDIIQPIAEDPPDGWVRISTDPPLNYVTSFAYNNPGSALSDVYFPNGRRWASRVIYITKKETSETDANALLWNRTSPPNWDYDTDLVDLKPDDVFAREYIFSDLEPYGESSDDLRSRSLGEIHDYAGFSTTGTPIRVRKVYYAVDPGTPAGAEPDALPSSLVTQGKDQPRFVEEASVKAGLDANGRLTQADLLEADSTGAMLSVGNKEINDLVDNRREREIDGTITRTIKNLLGQPVRTYLGTDDLGWLSPENGPNNMVVLNRTQYGNSASDALMPTVVRNYTAQPSWWGDYYSEVGSSDPDGYAVRTSYDWRMRPVRVDVFGEDPVSRSRDPNALAVPRLTTSLTILDHQDRPIIEVSFGSESLPSLPSTLDPVTRTPADELSSPRPQAGAYLGYSTKPISLIENLYGPDGGLYEKRTYDVSSDAGNPRWHSSLSYCGRNGVEVYSQQPQQPVTKARLDGLGRMASQSSLGLQSGHWTFELGRTDFTIDADGNVVDTHRFERAVFDTQAKLSDWNVSTGTAGNAVRTRTVSWFDPKKRGTATLELGTEQTTGFVAGPVRYARAINDGNASEPWMVFDINNPLAPPTIQNNPLLSASVDPAATMLSVNHFDLATGRLTHTRNADGSFTELRYDRAGRLATKIENRYGSEKLVRTTKFSYQYGRVVEIRATRVNAVTDGNGNTTSPSQDQVTRVAYGADVVAESRQPGARTYAVVSTRNDLVGRMCLPNPENGYAGTSSDIVLRYTFGGGVAERIDLRGVTFRYFYDALGRVNEVVIGHYVDAELREFLEGYPDEMTPPTGVPVDRVGFVSYEYDKRGNLADVIAYVSRGGAVVSHNRYTYDLRGNLTGEYQLHGQTITAANESTTPITNYQWEYKKTDDVDPTQIGCDRLIQMTYPAQLYQPRRVVKFSYGSSGSTDDVISRLSRMSSLLSSQTSEQAVDVANFQYVGVSRRRSVSVGQGQGSITADYHMGTEVGLAGLDRFGRPADLNYKSVGGNILFRGRYAYDVAGNRISAEITQAPVGGASQVNTRSQLNAYNQLNQLVGTQVGAIESSNGETTISNLIRADTWALDTLGNWSSTNGPNTAGRYSTGNLDGGQGYQLGGYETGSSLIPWTDGAGATAGTDIRAITHRVNERNQINTLETYNSNPQGLTTTDVRYDLAGNLIFDGTYLYQYDAWSRLIQINRGHLEIAGAFALLEGDSQAPPNTTPVADELVKHYTYDGIGRLIATQSPYPSVDDNQGLRTEAFYYDGDRRIQEVVIDPIQTLEAAAASNDYSVQQAASTSVSQQSAAVGYGQVDESATPMSVQQAQTQSVTAGNPIGLPINARLEREYIWGPGDGLAGVDECFVQYDSARKPWWVLQDAGGDVAAVCDNGTQVTGTPQVAAQWTYDAYGSVLSADHLLAHPFLHLGHKGLFFDRLDVGAADAAVPGAAAQETPRLVPFAHAIYHNRNRAYNPQFGRFMQMDPNAAGQTLIGAAAYNGRGMAALAVAFDLSDRYGDGANLYQYLGSNPWTRSDPTGLSWDPFDLVDDYLSESAGSSAAFLQSVGQGAKSLAILTAQIATFLPFPGANLAGELALVALGEQTSEQAAVSIAIGLIPAGKLLGAAGKGLGKVFGFVGKIGGAAWSAAKHYAGKATKALWHGAEGLISRAAKFLTKACGCFEADTEVWTLRGLIPISEVTTDDDVLAQDEATGELSWRSVIRTFVRKGAPIVAVTLIGTADASPLATPDSVDSVVSVATQPSGDFTLNTTEEHPFLVDCGWVQAGQLKPGDAVRTVDGTVAIVLSVAFTNRTAEVFNLEVEGLHDYHVGPDGVVVHNCNLLKFTRGNFLANLSRVLPRPGSKYQAHHLVPQRYVYLFGEEFIHSPKNAAWVYSSVHGSGEVGTVTRLWEDWARANPKPSKAEVLQFAREVEERAGIWFIKPDLP